MPAAMPADFADRAAALQSVSALARVYQCHRHTVRGWIRRAGIDTSGWVIRHQIDRIAALTAADLQAARTRDEAKRLLGIGSETASALAKANGVTWARRSRMLRLAPQHVRALLYLRTKGVEDERVLDLGEAYAQLHNGRRYAIGRRLFNAAEIVDRALKKGWRQ